MEFEGKVIQILTKTEGTSARGPWQRQDVLFEMVQEFSRKLCVTFFNKPDDVAKLRVGESYTVSVNVESREYNGRWYTDVRAWRIQPKQAAAPEASMPEYPPYGEDPVAPAANHFGYGASATTGGSPMAPAAPVSEVDDLPF